MSTRRLVAHETGNMSRKNLTMLMNNVLHDYEKPVIDNRTRRRRAVGPGDNVLVGQRCSPEFAKRVRKIRELYKERGWTQQRIADRYGLSRSSVSKITRGETYANC